MNKKIAEYVIGKKGEIFGPKILILGSYEWKLRKFRQTLFYREVPEDPEISIFNIC